jgi:hypothetical protein
MKNLFILSGLLLATLFVSCGDDEPTLTTTDWVLSSNALSKTQSVNSGDNTLVSLTLETTDLCPDSGVRVVVDVNGTEQFNELIEAFDYNLDITVSKNVDIDITTSIEGIPNSPVTCITLGSVQCSLTY